MKKCDCYEERVERHYITDFERGLRYISNNTNDYEYRVYGVCLGTKECDRCSCGGDRRICDFYEDNRNECKPDNTNDSTSEKSMNDNLDLLFTSFDEMGFVPTTCCENPEEYAREWKQDVIKEIEALKLENSCLLKQLKECSSKLIDVINTYSHEE